jgi:methylated-DNA-[protein]-cysteine S-methyltransferase
MNTRHCIIDSRLGELTVVADGDALTGVYFRHHWHRPDQSSFRTLIDAHSDVLLAAIPHGATVTYGELANALADGTTPQEVGQAVGRNGQLTGCAGGLKRKQFLLDLEEPADVVKAARLF